MSENLRRTGALEEELMTFCDAFRALKPGQAMVDLGENSCRIGIAFYWLKGEPDIHGLGCNDKNYLIIDLPDLGGANAKHNP